MVAVIVVACDENAPTLIVSSYSYYNISCERLSFANWSTCALKLAKPRVVSGLSKTGGLGGWLCKSREAQFGKFRHLCALNWQNQGWWIVT